MPKTLEDLKEDEFDKMLADMSAPEYDALTADEFFGILAAMDTQDEIHLRGRIENGRFVFEEPAPLPVKGNVLQLGTKRIVIDVQEEAISSTA